MTVWTLGEREELGNSFDELLLRMFECRLGNPGRSSIDSKPGARVPERSSVRGISVLSENFVDVLVSHLVLEDFEDRAPVILEHEPAGYLDRTSLPHPPTEVDARGDDLESGGSEGAAEVRVVELSPRLEKLSHERGLKF
jgi:hypothetical protein